MRPTIPTISFPLMIFFFLCPFFAQSQVNVSRQIESISSDISEYVDCYLYDFCAHQGVGIQNNMNTTGDVLNQFEFRLGLKFGTGINYSSPAGNYSHNIKISGSEPSAFGSEEPGKLYYRFIDEITGSPMYHPFTGEEIGFNIPLLPGIGTGVGLGPSLIPTLEVGLGYGTEIQIGLLPGTFKALSKNIDEDFTLTKDLLFSTGIAHDIFYWIDPLKDRNYHLKLGLSYNLISLSALVANSYFDVVNNSNTDLIRLTNNLSGIDYKASNLGFEMMVSKKLRFVDLSLFCSSNNSIYSIHNVGELEISITKDLYKDIELGSDTYTIENIIDIDTKVNQFLYGASCQFNFGAIHFGLKYGHSNARYLSGYFGVRFLDLDK